MPRIHTVAADGVITAGDKLIGSDGGQDKNFVTRNYTVGGVKDFILNGTHAGSFTTLTTTGNATIGGNVTIAGNITVGDADTDTISFAADVISNIIPDATNTYTLGTAAKKWKDIHAEGSIKAGSIWLDGTLSEISGVTNIYTQKIFDSQDSTYFLDPSASISLKVKGSIQLGDANAETNAEITSYGDLILKADVDNDGNYDRGVEIFRTRGGNDGGTTIYFNRNQYDLDNQSLPVSIFNQIAVGKVVHGLGGGSNYQNISSATISSIVGWMDASNNVLGTVLDEPPVGATQLKVQMNTSISYSNSAYLTILDSSATFNEDVTRNIKFFSGSSQVASIDKDGKLTVSAIDAGSSAITTTGNLNVGSIAATGTIVANNTNTINGININNSTQEISGIGNIYAHKFFDSQDDNYYVDPGHSGISVNVAGQIIGAGNANIGGIAINASNKEVSGVGDLYAYKFIDSQTGTHYLDPGNSTLSLVTAGKITIGAFTIPKTIGTAGQVLKVPSSGTELEWGTATASAQIGDLSVTPISSADDFKVLIDGNSAGISVLSNSGTSGSSSVVVGKDGQINGGIFEYNKALSAVRIQRHGAVYITINSLGVALSGIPTHADDTAAGTAGLLAGQLYKTSGGDLKIKL